MIITNANSDIKKSILKIKVVPKFSDETEAVFLNRNQIKILFLRSWKL